MGDLKGGSDALLTWTNQCSVSPKKGQPMEPLGSGRAEARSRLSVQRRVQRCWARLSNRPAHRRAVPAAPSTDRELSPQGNMMSLRGGREEGVEQAAGSAGEARTAERAVFTCQVRRGLGLGVKPEDYTIGQELRVTAGQ